MNRRKQLDGKIALITGASQGQGEAEARLFVERGAKVILGDINEKKGMKLQKELGSSAEFFKLNVSSDEDWKELINSVKSRHRYLNVLICNAGISPAPKNIENLKLKEYLEVINTNQIGTFLAIKSSLPLLKKAKTASIITISSTAGLNGVTGLAPYASSKFAIRALTKVASLELGQYGIDTEMLRPEGEWGIDMRKALANSNPLGKIGTPTDIAEMAAFLASDASSFCNGADFVVDGGILAGTFSPPDSSDPWEV